MFRPFCLGQLAEAYIGIGKIEKAFSVLDEALEVAEITGERYYNAEIYRLQGELLLTSGTASEAEAKFQQAIEFTRRQQAKSLELRAVVSLARLWQSQGKQEEARQMLTEIYGWFTEGFNTVDLLAAQALLEELS
jgi:predicted ATPase